MKALIITGSIDPITHKGMGRYSQELIDRLGQYIQRDVLVTDDRPLARLVESHNCFFVLCYTVK